MIIINVVVRQDEINELKHYGKLGMKWGTRTHNKRASSLSNAVANATRKADSSLNMFSGVRKRNQKKVRKLSKQVRNEKASVDRNIRRGEKFLKKAAEADAAKIVNRFNKDPEKREMTKKYVESLKINSTTLSELRLQTIDLRLD